MAEFRDLTGHKCGRCFVLGLSCSGPSSRYPIWLCRCSCGVERPVRASSLAARSPRQRSTSCGCYQKELAAAMGKKYGGKRKMSSRRYAKRKKKAEEQKPKPTELTKLMIAALAAPRKGE